MADLVMDVKGATAQRSGNRLVVKVNGETMNSRDRVYGDATVQGDTAQVYVRFEPAGGMGTMMTGPYSIEVKVDGAADVHTVQVHGRNGTKTVKVG